MPPIVRTSITCTKCQYHYEVEDKFLGKLLTCPKCQGKFYSQASGTDLKQTIRSSAANTAKTKTVNTDAHFDRKARRRKIITRTLAVLGVLILVFFLWESFKFATRPIDDKPDPKLAYNAAQDFMKTKSGLANIDIAIFSKKFTLANIDSKKKTYSIKTSINILMPEQKKPTDNKITINMAYLGEEKWEYTDYSFDK
ncbi:MAG TPA: hypothetical protein DCZ94_07405 [Lentisphaeria bacterium]|nr:MAG: hypothetical protein A2X48_20550 [Lentisphaerae bacterium GWF2_49_21]HBC86762.1 hypothetical protein [Lentisphaeria bacterium]